MKLCTNIINMIQQRQKPNRRANFFIYHLPVILYAAAIIVLSSLSHLKTPEIRFLAFDKIAHFFEYAIFAFLAVRSFLHISVKISEEKAFLFTSLFIVIFAIFDEYFVQTLSHRNSSVYDLLSDVGGAFLLLTVLRIFNKKKGKKK